MPALATALLLLAAAPAALPRGALDGCTELIATGTLIAIQCPGEVVLYAHENDRDPERTVESLRTKLAKATGGRATRERVRLPLGGELRDVVRARGTKRPAFLLFVAAPRRRSYGCIGPERAREPRCRELLDALVRDGLPERFAERVRVPDRFHVAGRALVPPRGCETLTLSRTYGQLECGNTGFAWFSGEDVIIDPIWERWPEQFAAQLPDGSWDDAVPCRMESAPATCRRRTGVANGERIEMLIGRTRARETNLIAFCIRPAAERLPAPCSAVFEPAGLERAGAAARGVSE